MSGFDYSKQTNNTFLDALSSGVFSKARNEQAGGPGRIFTGVLFIMFIIVLLLAVLAGVGLYKALNEMREATDATRLSLSLISNDVRAADSIDAVAVGVGPEGNALVLRENLSTGRFETRIYLYNGSIVEEYALQDSAYTPQKATVLTKSETFSFSYRNGLLTVLTDQGTANIALRSVRGGD